MDNKEKILKVLTNEWQSTKKIAREAKINWYVAIKILNDFYHEDKKVLRIVVGKTTGWKLNQVKEVKND